MKRAGLSACPFLLCLIKYSRTGGTCGGTCSQGNHHAVNDRKNNTDDHADDGTFSARFCAQRQGILPYEIQDQSDDREQETQECKPEAGCIRRLRRIGLLNGLLRRRALRLLLTCTARGAKGCPVFNFLSAISAKQFSFPPYIFLADLKRSHTKTTTVNRDKQQRKKYKESQQIQNDLCDDTDQRPQSAHFRAVGILRLPDQIQNKAEQRQKEAGHRPTCIGHVFLGRARDALAVSIRRRMLRIRLLLLNRFPARGAKTSILRQFFPAISAIHFCDRPPFF